MTIISIDTSTDVCSAALSVGGITLACYVEKEGANHAAVLPVFVEKLLATMHEKGLSLEAVALSEGPGSYTGLRIGASLAKGLCYGEQVPLIPIPTTDVLCAAFAARAEVVEPHALLCPMIDARRMEVYTALYDLNISSVNPVEAKVIDETSFDEVLGKKPVYFFGNGAMKCNSVISSKNAHFIDGICPLAEYMGVLAESLSYRRIEKSELAYFDPFYLKDFVAAPSHVKGLK